MITRNEILKQMCLLVEQNSLGKIKADSIKETDHLMSDLKLDSLDYATVMLGLEVWAKVKVNENRVNWQEVQTVGQLTDLIFSSQ